MLDELATAIAAAREDDRPPLFALLAETYTGVTAVSYALGYFDLRSLAMERIAWASAESGDPLRVARVQWQRSTLFLQAAAYDRGLRLLDRVRHDLGDDMSRMDPVTLSLYGATHLRAVIFAARSADRAGVDGHLAEAGDAARLLGRDANHLGLEFGPTNVAMHALAAAVEL